MASGATFKGSRPCGAETGSNSPPSHRAHPTSLLLQLEVNLTVPYVVTITITVPESFIYFIFLTLPSSPVKGILLLIPTLQMRRLREASQGHTHLGTLPGLSVLELVAFQPLSHGGVGG